MNDMAYDITHLLESEPVKFEVPDLPVTRGPIKASPAVSVPSNVAVAQEAMARELMQVAEAHEALIQQYLRFTGDTFQDTSG
jgi:hypothetical protein